MPSPLEVCNVPWLGADDAVCVPLIPNSILGHAALEGKGSNLELSPNIEGQGYVCKTARPDPWYKKGIPKTEPYDFVEETGLPGEEPPFPNPNPNPNPNRRRWTPRGTPLLIISSPSLCSTVRENRSPSYRYSTS